MNYRTRVIDALLVDYLQVMGGVLIQGPKACGKTTTGHQYSKSELLLSSPAARIEAKQLLGFNSDLLLTGKTPRLIDEWQVIPELWDEIHSEIDVRGQAGQFIVTAPPSLSKYFLIANQEGAETNKWHNPIRSKRKI